MNIRMATQNLNALLDGARVVISSVRYCWLITHGEGQMVSVRPMGRLLDTTDWAIRFVTDRRSRKVADLRRNAQVELIFQASPTDAFVVVAGEARMLDNAAESARLWKDAFSVYFPSEEDRKNVAFVEVDPKRMDLWIRGVTPEPFGLTATVLERCSESTGGWALRPAEAGQ